MEVTWVRGRIKGSKSKVALYSLKYVKSQGSVKYLDEDKSLILLSTVVIQQMCLKTTLSTLLHIVLNLTFIDLI